MAEQAYTFDRQGMGRAIKTIRQVEQQAQTRERASYGQQVPRITQIFSARIIATPTAINGAIRWRYQIQLGHWDMSTGAMTGGTWVVDSGAEVLYAFNEAEDMNTFSTTTGTIGTGNTNVTLADGTINGGQCHLLPLANGDFVSVKLRGIDANGQRYFTIINKSNSGQ